ncbi:MAG: alanine--tRNA ligase [bacterium]|nr:alanine--tRNA ligase [bacterium]
MTHLEIREKFINFFKEKGHVLVPSSSLLPTDPSVLFTTAGVQQFKPYYLGQADPLKDFGSKNVISIQKSLRTVDIEEVGDNSHITFFEMLGYFSFGEYFKKETIEWTYEFLTKVLAFDRERIKPTVFAGDDRAPFDKESFDVWQSLGFDKEEIGLGNRHDNFWGPVGNEGPCGPANEIYIDGIEIGTLVFNEYFCDQDKKLTPLKQNGVDVGLGFERIAIFSQKVSSIYETDLFIPLMVEIRGGNLYDFEKNLSSERIIADHLRSSIFLIADGVRPSNVGQGYILRRLLRRAIRHAKLLNQPEDLYERILHVLEHDIYAWTYPELKIKQKEILEVIVAEKEKFTKTLERGLREFSKLTSISGRQAFDLYTTYGFPVELIEEMAKEKGLDIDLAGFEQEIETHKEKSRAGAEKKFGGHGLLLDTGELKAATEEEVKIVTRLHTATHLLHASLRKILGEGVKQAGSDITAERLRFDFTFPRKLTEEEIKKVEDLVNEVIAQDLKVSKEEMPYEEAVKTGALRFFKQKYPEIVNVYSVGNFSKELCGGPHVSHTAEIGHFKIIKEEAVAAGVRRIRAVVQ